MTIDYTVDNSVVINQVAVLFLIMVVGFFLRKRGTLTGELIKGFSSFLLNVTLPFMVLAAFHMEFSREMLRSAGLVFLAAFFIHLFALLASGFLFGRYAPKIKKILRFITVFSNCGYMGLPVLESIYGKTGVFYGSIFIMVFKLFLWTAGIMLFTGVKDWHTLWEAVKNPGIMAVAAGMIIFLFSLPVPSPLYKTFDLIGSMTTPLSMIIVGALLADLKLKEVFSDFSVYYGALLRLVVLPLLTMGLLRVLGFTGLLIRVIVTLVAMPAAAATVIFADKFNNNPEYASLIVFITTILSMITIPAMIFLIGVLAA